MRRLGLVTLSALTILGGLTTSTARSAAPPLPPDLDPPIDAIVAPLAHAPTITASAFGDLIVEVDPDRVPVPLDVLIASVRPSHPGDGDIVGSVPVNDVEPGVASDLWPGRLVTKLTFAFGDLPPDLYDVTVSSLLWSDTQRRALSVVDEIPTAPRVAILADPSVGDPRPLQEGATEALPPGPPFPEESRGDPTFLPSRVLGTTGNPAAGEPRWAALNAAIDEINLTRPDFVLLAGDLTFGAHPRPYPYEYAEVWQVLDRLEVPSFASPGNHDLYSTDYDRYPHPEGTDRPHTGDGLAEWQRWFGPLFYATDIGDDLHLVSLNTFDWPDMRPFPPPDFDTLSGGQILEEQLAWLAADLAAFRTDNPDGALITFAHHDPSWLARRHPWPDRDNRNAVRELLAAQDVWVHFAGHTHEDRVARYHDGSIVETNGRQHLAHHYPLGQLHYLDIDAGDLDPGAYTQAELGAMLRDPANGPLFVTTTTAASGLIGEDWGLGGYWGWRLATLDPQPGGGYDPHDLGYAADASVAEVAAFLAATATRPERWNPAHAVFGVHSVPTGHLHQTVSADGGTVTVRNDLLDAVEVQVRLRVPSGSGDWTPTHGRLVQLRAVPGGSEAIVRLTVPSRGERVVTLLPR